MMIEPNAAPAEVDPLAMTPEQAVAEIAQIRGNVEHDWHHEGRSGFDAANERMIALYQRAHGPDTGTPGELDTAPPGETGPRPNVFADPHADPTAAILDQVPPPALAPDAVKAGVQWDSAKLHAVNAVAEREGVTGLVLQGRYVVAEALSGPPVDAVTAERQLHQRWGSMFPSKLEAAHLAFDALPADVRVDLERRELDVHPAVMDYLARVGEALMDPSTPGGERRLKAKYADRTGG